MEDAAKRAFMETMDEQFVKEFGFDLKTVMLFADAVYKVKTFKEKELEAELELVKKERDCAIKRVRELFWCSQCRHNRGLAGCAIDARGKCFKDNDLYEWKGLD